MSAFPYQHPRRKTGPVQPGERVKLVDEDGIARHHGTLELVRGSWGRIVWDDHNTLIQNILPIRWLQRIG